MQIATSSFPGPVHCITHRMSDESVLRMVSGYSGNGLLNVTIAAFPEVTDTQQPMSENPRI